MSFGSLEILYGDGRRATAALVKPTVHLGRAADNDVVLDDSTVADYHAQLLCSPKGCQVLDLGSDSGMSVSGARLAAQTPYDLSEGAQLEIGGVALTYRSPAAATEHAVPPAGATTHLPAGASPAPSPNVARPSGTAAQQRMSATTKLPAIAGPDTDKTTLLGPAAPQPAPRQGRTSHQPAAHSVRLGTTSRQPPPPISSAGPPAGPFEQPPRRWSEQAQFGASPPPRSSRRTLLLSSAGLIAFLILLFGGIAVLRSLLGAAPPVDNPPIAEAASPPTTAPTPTLVPTLTPAVPVASKITNIKAEASSVAGEGIDGCTGLSVSYPAANVVDSKPDTAWRVEGDGVGQWLELTFEQPIMISQLGIMAGYNKVDPCGNNTDRFLENHIPRTLKLEFGDTEQPRFEELEAKRELQTISVPNIQTQRLRIVILESHPRLGEKEWEGERTAISEIEVWGTPGN